MDLMCYNPMGHAIFFVYNEKIYTKCTVVKPSQIFVDSYKIKGEDLWTYYRLMDVIVKNGITYYHFQITRVLDCDFYKYKTSILVNQFEIDTFVGEITIPIEVEIGKDNTPFIPKKDWEDKNMLMAWIVYIVVMIGSLIFKQFYIVWIIATIIFLKYRLDR